MSGFRRRLMMVRKEQPVLGGYVINQSTHTTSANMISVNSGVFSRIDAIHLASHLYVCELVNDVLQCKQLSDTNKTQYVDSTTAIVGANQDVMMKLPQFWWKVTPDSNNDDIAEVDFVLENPEDSSWHEWEGNTFIGAYKGFVSDSKLYSQSGLNVGSYTRTSPNNYRTYARNRGNGFTCITYEMIQMLALLGFGRLKVLSPNAVYGFGVSQSSSHTSGNCDSLGMTDGRVGNYSNFWGLEDYVTGVGYSEYIDNLSRASGTLVNILDPFTRATKRQVTIPVASGNYWMQKIVLGTYGDTLPKAVVSSRPGYSTGYNGFINISNDTKDGFIFMNSANSSNTSFVSLQCTGASSATSNYAVSRLQYQGNYTIL